MGCSSCTNSLVPTAAELAASQRVPTLDSPEVHMAIRRASRRTEPVPATMKAAANDRFGPPSVIKLRTLPVPEPGPNQVLIAVHAAGLGFWDAQIREGVWAEE